MRERASRSSASQCAAHLACCSCAADATEAGARIVDNVATMAAFVAAGTWANGEAIEDLDMADFEDFIRKDLPVFYRTI